MYTGEDIQNQDCGRRHRFSSYLHSFSFISTPGHSFGMFSRLRSTVAPAASLLMIAGVNSTSHGTTHCSSEDHIPSLDYGWSHHGAFQAFDKKSVRRGFQVYKQVRIASLLSHSSFYRGSFYTSSILSFFFLFIYISL